MVAIFDLLGIDGRGVVDFMPLCDKNGEEDFGLVVGCNIGGILEDQYRAVLQGIFAPHVEPKWYLDPVVPHWRRFIGKKVLSKNME